MRYAVYSSAGEPLYVGTLTFSVRAGEKNPYTDVKSTDWFYPYVIALTESGVIGGNTRYHLRSPECRHLGRGPEDGTAGRRV